MRRTAGVAKCDIGNEHSTSAPASAACAFGRCAASSGTMNAAFHAAPAHASRDPGDRARHHAGDVSGRARPDHRGDRAADHRPAFQQSRRPRLGGHRLSAHRDRGDAALRQAVRHPRPARLDAGRHRHFRRRLADLRDGAQHDRAGARPRGAGAGRRRPDGAGADHHRRHRLPTRARPLPGLYRRGVCDLFGRRAGARRLPDRASRLVADLLDQPAARLGRARHDVERAQARAVSSAQAPARRARRAV